MTTMMVKVMTMMIVNVGDMSLLLSKNEKIIRDLRVMRKFFHPQLLITTFDDPNF